MNELNSTKSEISEGTIDSIICTNEVNPHYHTSGLGYKGNKAKQFRLEVTAGRVENTIKKLNDLVNGINGNKDPYSWEVNRNRRLFTMSISWCCLPKDTIDAIVKFLHDNKCIVLAVGVGHGIYPLILKHFGIKVYLTDPFPTFPGVLSLDAVAASTAAKGVCNTLWVSWPSSNEHWAYEALKNLDPKCVVYIGEGMDGCTANNDFHQYLEDHYYKITELDCNRFPGIYDSVKCYVKKDATSWEVTLDDLRHLLTKSTEKPPKPIGKPPKPTGKPPKPTGKPPKPTGKPPVKKGPHKPIGKPPVKKDTI